MRYKDALRLLRAFENAVRAHEFAGSENPKTAKLLEKSFKDARANMRGLLKELCQQCQQESTTTTTTELTPSRPVAQIAEFLLPSKHE